jgi:hypothetical protein
MRGKDTQVERKELTIRRVAIAICLSGGLLAAAAGSAGAATLSPSSAHFGTEAVGEVTKPKIFTVTAEAADAVLPMTIATTGDFKQTNNCPSTVGFLTATSCEINVIFAPKARGARTGTLTTTSPVLGGPSAVLAGNGTPASRLNAGKCKTKGKKKAKKGAVAAKKKKDKKGKKCKGKKAKKGKGKKK